MKDLASKLEIPKRLSDVKDKLRWVRETRIGSFETVKVKDGDANRRQTVDGDILRSGDLVLVWKHKAELKKNKAGILGKVAKLFLNED